MTLRERISNFIRELSWIRKLAVALWLICALGTFLANNLLHEARAVALAVVTVPLLLIWIGDWLSDDDSMDMSVGTILLDVCGKGMILIGWMIFARLVAALVIAPIILKTA